jgi:hypothetical protein
MLTGREYAHLDAGGSPWREAMAEEEKKNFGPKKRFTKGQAVGVMVAGGLLLVLPWFFPSEQGSNLQLAKTALSVVGFIGLCLGAYFRP